MPKIQVTTRRAMEGDTLCVAFVGALDATGAATRTLVAAYGVVTESPQTKRAAKSARKSPPKTKTAENDNHNNGIPATGHVVLRSKDASWAVLNVSANKTDLVADQYRFAGANAFSLAKSQGFRRMALVLDGAEALTALEPVLEGLLLRSYKFKKYLSPTKPTPDLEVSIIVNPTDATAAKAVLKKVTEVADAINMARDLGNEPPDVLTPTSLVAHTRALARRAGLGLRVLETRELQRQRCGGILAVGRGAVHPPRLIILEYNPRGTRAAKNSTKTSAKTNRSPLPHLVLVGKGVTFDTGGVSLKPGKNMHHMKADMGGAAAVLGAMQAIAALGVRVRVTAYVPTVLNAIGSRAYLPGEIIRARSGKTVQVDNTDAEGRLILMDALHMAAETRPDYIVDAATLTGSVVRAIGPTLAGLFSRHDPLASIIETAASASGDPVWRLPLFDEYRSMLNCDVADINNTGGINAGSITAALFLSEFVPREQPWAHLDIAGPAYVEKSWRYLGAGATGFGVRLFVKLAQNLAEGQSPNS